MFICRLKHLRLFVTDFFKFSIDEQTNATSKNT